MKVQRLNETALEFNFNSPRQEFSLYRNLFLQSEIGKIYLTILWDDLVKHFKLKENRKGSTRIFSPRGMIALTWMY